MKFLHYSGFSLRVVADLHGCDSCGMVAVVTARTQLCERVATAPHGPAYKSDILKVG